MSLNDVLVLLLALPVLLVMTSIKVMIAIYIADKISSRRLRMDYEHYCTACR